MRNLIVILFLIVSVSVFGSESNNPVKSNRAIEEVSWALEASKWDYDQAMAVSFYEVEDKSDLSCEIRGHQEAVKLFGRAINGFRNYFPDEELPYNAALQGLQSILSKGELEYCYLEYQGEKIWQIYLDNNFLFSVEQ